ncbi:MAG: acetylxylan esterase [Prevotella sp.]|nr:acetylxylan esterase [Prevotella sp.]
MRKLFVILLGLISSIGLSAENYPYRSDYLWVTVPNHADWLYKTGEQATVEVQFYKYGIPRDGVVEYAIGNDLMDADTKGTVTLKNGRGVIKAGTAKKPCFRDIRLTMKLDGTTYQHHVKIGFSPEKIIPYTQEPKDFWQFWQDNLKEAANYPLKFTKTPCPEFTTDKTDCYLVHIELNRQHQALYGLLMMPKNLPQSGEAGGGFPVVLCPPGAGVKTIKEPNSRDYYPENGVIRFITEIHGMNPLMPESYFNDVRSAFDGREKGYLYQGIDSRDHYYMKHVYLGLVRCIDFLCSLPEWDGKNVIAQGGSQGGALSLIAAALDPRVTLCVANHPALSDMAAAAEEGRTHGYPHFSKQEGFLTPQHLQTLPYFDVCCFAPYIKAKTYMTWGYNDNTCPPTTSYAVWNLLRCEKESLITPVNEHWTSGVTNRQQLDWILQNIK